MKQRGGYPTQYAAFGQMHALRRNFGGLKGHTKDPCWAILHVTPNSDTVSTTKKTTIVQKEKKRRGSDVPRWQQSCEHSSVTILNVNKGQVMYHVIPHTVSRTARCLSKSEKRATTFQRMVWGSRMSGHCSACFKTRNSTHAWRCRNVTATCIPDPEPNTSCQSRENLAMEGKNTAPRTETCACMYICMRVADCPASMC